MPEETLQNESGNVDSTDYIAAIKELKENSVSKEDFIKIQEEKRQLLKALVDGDTISTETEKPKKSLEELRNKAFKQNCTNLESVTNILEYRQALIDSGKPDPFLPVSSNTNPDYQDSLDAENVAKCMQDCVDIANGNPDVFNNEWSRRIIDTPVLNRKGYR